MKFAKLFAFTGLVKAGSRTKRDSDILQITGEETIEELDALLLNLDDSPELRMGGEMEEEENLMEKMNPRKFRQWRLMVMFLQRGNPDRRRWKHFQKYGCHCLPDGAKLIGAAGFGKPVDAIDKSCMDFHQCYKCITMEHGDETKGCAGESVRYKFEAHMDKVTYKKTLTCTDPEGSCPYNVCQCDLAQAKKFAALAGEWKAEYHAGKWGNFDKEASCRRAGSAADTGYGSGSAGAEVLECCGDKYTFPFNKPRHANQCCKGTQAKPLSQC